MMTDALWQTIADLTVTVFEASQQWRVNRLVAITMMAVR